MHSKMRAGVSGKMWSYVSICKIKYWIYSAYLLHIRILI
jgi:IS1 family transposase